MGKGNDESSVPFSDGSFVRYQEGSARGYIISQKAIVVSVRDDVVLVCPLTKQNERVTLKRSDCKPLALCEVQEDLVGLRAKLNDHNAPTPYGEVVKERLKNGMLEVVISYGDDSESNFSRITDLTFKAPLYIL